MFLIYRCCLALQEQDSAGLQAVSASIRGRGVRISEVVTQEMDGFEAGDYSDRVREAVKLLQTELIPNFERHVVTAVGGVEEGYKGVDENEFIEACRLVYDGVREVRRAVLVNRDTGEDTDTEEEQEEEVTRPLEVAEVSLVDEYPDISGVKLIMYYLEIVRTYVCFLMFFLCQDLNNGSLNFQGIVCFD